MTIARTTTTTFGRRAPRGAPDDILRAEARLVEELRRARQARDVEAIHAADTALRRILT